MADGMEIKIKGDEIESFRKRLFVAGCYLGEDIDEAKKDHKSNITANKSAHMRFAEEKELRKNTQNSAINECKNIATMKENYEDADQQASNYITVDLTANIPDYNKYNTKNSNTLDQAELQEIYDEIMADEAKKKARKEAFDKLFKGH